MMDRIAWLEKRVEELEGRRDVTLLSMAEDKELLAYRTTDPIHRLLDLPKGHPCKLVCIEHEGKRYRKVRPLRLREWAEANEDPGKPRPIAEDLQI